MAPVPLHIPMSSFKFQLEITSRVLGISKVPTVRAMSKFPDMVNGKEH